MTPAPAERSSQQRNSGKSACLLPTSHTRSFAASESKAGKARIAAVSPSFFLRSCSNPRVALVLCCWEPQRVRTSHCSLALCLSLTEVEPQAAKKGWQAGYRYLGGTCTSPARGGLDVPFAASRWVWTRYHYSATRVLGPLVERRQTGSLASTARVGLHYSTALCKAPVSAHASKKYTLMPFTLRPCEERGAAAADAAPVGRHMERCQEIVAVLLIAWSAGDGLECIS